jgi:hypothetical protein
MWCFQVLFDNVDPEFLNTSCKRSLWEKALRLHEVVREEIAAVAK